MNRPSGEWMLLLRWMAANTVSSVAGIGASLVVLEATGEIASSIVFGAMTGLAQWLVLRRQFDVPAWWVLSTTLSIPLGFAANHAAYRAMFGGGVPVVDGTIGFAALGLVVGTVQWSVLRGRVSRACWWIPASITGWAVGGLVAWMAGLQLIEFNKVVTDFAMIGVISGAITGLALILLLRSPAKPSAGRMDLFGRLVPAGCALLLIIILGLPPGTGGSSDMNTPPTQVSVPSCSGLPPLDCAGDDTYCTELVPFEPPTGAGYINYPVGGETDDDQYRSHVRRDLLMLIRYASATVACESEGWGYNSFKPLGLGDMSEADGSIPGSSTGHPDHPPGTHQDGQDIDIAYFQVDTPAAWLRLEEGWQGLDGNLLMPVCSHARFGSDVYHCTEPPHLLDPYRTALFIARLAEHPGLRVIGVDGRIGPVLDAALDQLVQAGWVDPELRKRVPLAYEIKNEGKGWFWYHHHHMHVSMQPA